MSFEAKTYLAAGVIPAYSIVKFGADDNTVVVATAATDLVIGISDNLDAIQGERVDIKLIGIAEVKFGGTVAKGAPITANASGQAVAATSGNVIGYALISASAGDVAPIVIGRSTIKA